MSKSGKKVVFSDMSTWQKVVHVWGYTSIILTGITVTTAIVGTAMGYDFNKK